MAVSVPGQWFYQSGPALLVLFDLGYEVGAANITLGLETSQRH